MPDKLPVSFTSTEITYRLQYAHLHGYKFDLHDTIETLEEVEHGPIQIEKILCDKLINLKVIESNGSRRSMTGATKGENFDAFLQALNDRKDRINDDA